MSTKAKSTKPKRSAYKKKAPVVSKATKQYVKEALKEDKETNWALIDDSQQGLSYDTPLLAQWSSIAQGSTINQREGDRLEPLALRMRYNVTYATVNDSIARIIIFQWKPDTALDPPTMAKIMNTTGFDSVHSQYVFSAVLRKKFHILSDKTYYNKTGIPNSLELGQTNITKFSGKYIYYNPGGATTGKNNIFVLAFSNYPNGSTGTPYFNKISMLQWKDSQ